MDKVTARSSIKRSYIVCSTGRSSSNLLCRTLENLNIAGNPKEYFHPSDIKETFRGQNPPSFEDYCTQIIEESVILNGVFGIKIHWNHLQIFLEMCRKNHPELREKDDLQVIKSVFPEPQFIYIRREDTLRQAISTEIAQQTQIWVVKKSEGVQN